MPRQSRGPAPAPKRPTAAPAARPAPQQQQTRPASTAAAPPAQQHAQPPVAAPQASGGSGLFGQMASTAAGVAVGSSIGHAIGGFFGGGSSAAPAAPVEQQQQPVAQADDGSFVANSNYQAAGACATDVRNFRSCMDENRGDLTVCGWYLDQLKACQSAAARDRVMESCTFDPHSIHEQRDRRSGSPSSYSARQGYGKTGSCSANRIESSSGTVDILQKEPSGPKAKQEFSLFHPGLMCHGR
nr:mitochondrial intermembrane space cysteine motif-containing protein mix17 [Quercus suber]